MATPVSYLQDVETFRVFVATWNVGGKSPHSGLNLDDFLQVHDQSDIYVLGFQEIVPLNAGNVLVMEDNGPAAKWLSLISQSLNRSPNNINKTTSSTYDAANHSALRSLKLTTTSTAGGSHIFQRTSSSSLRTASKIFRVEKARLESCNCRTTELESRKYSKDSCFKCQPSNISSDDQEDEDDFSAEDDDDDGDGDGDGPPPHSFMFSDHHGFSTLRMKKYYSLIASKQMVGIFVSVWVRKELVQHISHLRISCVSRGRIMGCLRNKGCISVSMSFHRTSFCFVCSHLASGEKEGDELRRNSDVIEILKNTQFPSISKTPNCSRPEKILEHDRVIWLGDLNYRIALSYIETRKLLEENNWDALLDKDQLKIQREAGRVFKGWKEGKIYFAPTYKYYYNSDTYAGGTLNSKSKRRTPAWCDRILWHGNGIRQLSYVRGESRFSDHRPVCATFIVDVVRGYYRIQLDQIKKGISGV